MNEHSQTKSSVTLEAQGAILRMFGAGEASFQREVSQALMNRYVEMVCAMRAHASVEIGAHEGEYSFRLSGECERRDLRMARVAIEANPSVHANYEVRMKAVGVNFLNMAVSNKSGDLVFTVPLQEDGAEHTTMGSLHENRSAHLGAVREYKVRCEPLSAIVPLKPFVLWVDVEGANREIFVGSEEVLKGCIAIHVEVEEQELWPGQMLAQDLVAFLEKNGFVAVARDYQRMYQYNAVFVRRESQFNWQVDQFVHKFGADVRTAIAAATARAAMPS